MMSWYVCLASCSGCFALSWEQQRTGYGKIKKRFKGEKVTMESRLICCYAVPVLGVV